MQETVISTQTHHHCSSVLDIVKTLTKGDGISLCTSFHNQFVPPRSQIHFTIAKFDSHYKATSIREQNFRAFALKPLAFIPALGFSS